MAKVYLQSFRATNLLPRHASRTHRISQIIWLNDHTLGQTLVTTSQNSWKLMTPSLSLSAYSIIWSTSEEDRFSPTEAATFSNSSGPNEPEPVVSKASKMFWRVPSEALSPPKPKMSRKVPKSKSPVIPAALTMPRIWLAWLSRLRALMVLMSSSMEISPLPSQSKTSKTSLSLPTVSASSPLRVYLPASNPLAFDIRYFQFNKNLIETHPFKMLFKQNRWLPPQTAKGLFLRQTPRNRAKSPNPVCAPFPRHFSKAHWSAAAIC